MDKKMLWCALFLLALAFAAPSRGGISLLGESFPEDQAYGTVVEVFGADITVIQFDVPPTFKIGDRVDLTVMLDMTPLSLGIFEVAFFQNEQRLNTRPVSMAVEPRKDMQVIVSLHEQGAEDRRVQESITREPLPDLDVSGTGTEPSSRSIEGLMNSSNGGPASSGPFEGKVVEVKESTVTVSIPSGTEATILPGQRIDLFYITGTGEELPVGQWKISSVSKGFVKADPMNHSRKPVVGLKAVIQK